MSTSNTPRRGIVGAAIAVAALAALSTVSPGAAAPSAAGSDSFTLSISAPQTVYVGRPGIIKVIGTIPLRAVHLPYFVNVVSISPKVMSSCPAQSWDAKQIANATGAVLVHSSAAVPDTSGAFMIPVGIRPIAPGRTMVCAYTNDGAAVTLARVGRLMTVKRLRG